MMDKSKIDNLINITIENELRNLESENNFICNHNDKTSGLQFNQNIPSQRDLWIENIKLRNALMVAEVALDKVAGTLMGIAWVRPMVRNALIIIKETKERR
jgi:hypothetical protein